MTLRDPDIRPRVVARIAAAEPTVLVVQEWKIDADQSLIIDVAGIGESLACAYEIKSEADSLVRLARQVPLYSAAFNRCTLVVAEKHAMRAMPALPPSWGVLVPRGEVFETLREADVNPDARPERLLWASEIKALVRRFDLRATALQLQREYYARLGAETGFDYGAGPANPGKWHMLGALATLPQEMLTPLVCSALRARCGWRRPDGYHVNRDRRRVARSA